MSSTARSCSMHCASIGAGSGTGGFLQVAVSEAPTREELEVETLCWRALQIQPQDLSGVIPRSSFLDTFQFAESFTETPRSTQALSHQGST